MMKNRFSTNNNLLLSNVKKCKVILCTLNQSVLEALHLFI
uniref:Uncharacterized protein n=1 Tax=Anguilla anguilla TaxID=7936 RepID=A0A0E9WLS9_ANGAN